MLNVAVFILQLSLRQFGGIAVEQTFGFAPVSFFSGYIWQLVTYPFLHGSMMHLLFNLFILYMLGTELERRWGSKTFFKFYAVCALGGAVLHTLIWVVGLLFGGSFGSGVIPIIGASGALYGLFVAFGILYAEAPVLVFFVLPMKAKQFVMILTLIEIVSAVFYSDSGVAHLVHLGGMLAGYIMLKTQGPNLRGGGGGFGRRIFKKKGAMSRDEVRQRLRIVTNDDPDAKGDKGIPITWNRLRVIK